MEKQVGMPIQEGRNISMIITKKVDGSAMLQHCMNHHGGLEQQCQMRVKDRVRNDVTKREIPEAVRIERKKVKNEF